MSNLPLPVRIPSSSDFPTDVLIWMKQNAAPKMALKLMKCHKCFQHFPEFPYFVVKKVDYYPVDKKWCFKTLDNQEHFYNGLKSIVKLPKQLWLTFILDLTYIPELVSLIIPKIAVCDIERLELLKNQKLSFNEFKFLTKSGTVKMLLFENIFLKFENGDPVYFNTVLKYLPNVEYFDYYNGDVPFLRPNFVDTFREINASKLKNVHLDLCSYQDFEMFVKFMNHNPHIYYQCFFTHNSISDEEKKKLINYVDEILEAGITEYPPQSIKFPGQPYEQSEALDELVRWFC